MIVEWHCSLRYYDYTIKLFYGMTRKRRYLIEVAKIKAGFKVTARLGNVRPANVLADSLQAASNDAKDPPTTRDLVIDIEWGGPLPQTFLIHDSGRFSNQRIVMYATEEGLRLLARSGTWYMDGTFSTAPDCFRQLYVIRAEIGTTCASCVYAFLPGKTETVYTEMLEAVIAKFTALGFNTDPTVVITDFECAATSAVEIVLGGHVHKHGCSFHLTQCTWRKIQELLIDSKLLRLQNY